MRILVLQTLLYILLMGSAFGSVQKATASTPSEQAFTYAVAVNNNFVYFNKGKDLLIAEISTPTQPKVIAQLTFPYQVQDIAVKDQHLYVTLQTGGLQAVDISQPKAPKVVGKLEFGDRAESVFLTEDYAYVAARTEGLQIVDISDPARLKVVGFYKADEQAVDVAVSGNLAHVSATYGGHRIVDVSDPANPREIGSASRGSYDQGFSWGIDVADPFVYVANVEVGLRRVDISEVDRSQTNNKAPTVELIQAVQRPADVLVKEDYVYLADQGAGLRLFRANQDTLFEVSHLDLPGRVMDVALNGNYAYLAAQSAGLRIADVSDPLNPRKVGAWDSQPMAVNLSLANETVYVADRENGLWLMNKAQNPQKISIAPGHAEDVALSHPYAYIAEGSNGISVYNLSDPAQPQKVTGLPVQDKAVGVTVADQHAYVADGHAGLHIFDISNPSAPQRLGTFDPDTANASSFFTNPVAAWNVVVHKKIAYVLFDDGIRVLDVSQPDAPQEIQAVTTSERAIKAVVRDGHLYAAFDDGLRIFNLLSDGMIEQVGFYDAPSFVTDVAVSGNYAYITDLQDGFGKIDISALNAPKLIRFLPLPNRPLGFEISNGQAYIASGTSGVKVVDLSSLTNP